MRFALQHASCLQTLRQDMQESGLTTRDVKECVTTGLSYQRPVHQSAQHTLYEEAHAT